MTPLIPDPADGVSDPGGALAPDLECSTDPARLDVDRVHHWLSTDAYWALGRSREAQLRAIEHSLNIGVYTRASGRQVAYARVVTDRSTFAWLCDVYVDRPARGRGVGTALVGVVQELLEPWGVRRLTLATNDAHEVYARRGFRLLPDPERWMEHRPEWASPAPDARGRD
ncbi:GNAT family N-acetyltransferase [Streptomyces sp. AJS327]|uniref:GNAT family N-acetyltransferase n=1 Tax=Streptomyces sp. AJS327 TaxID=2545265 RepID=UPI0015DEC327|nr:GNAT family N-acetyltransferase [Streptomyces sp. AJS327]MBA0050740.1 GNAT family N-acetyltransferase [Streptomyces sp. AJS327]